jgi:ATP-dependent DNA ligase
VYERLSGYSAHEAERRGRELFQLMRAHDLEGIVAKLLADPYGSRVRWLKIKNPDYSQAEGPGRVVQPGARTG